MTREVNPAAERVFAIRRPSRKLLWLYLIRSLFATVAMPIVFLPLYFKYHTLQYHFDAKGVRVSWGILFRREVYLTYGRIQDIHVTAGLFERWLGLGTVEVQTASGSSSAELSIVGLEQYLEVRDFLYSVMRGLREHPPESDVKQLLEGIRDELKKTRAALEQRRV
jgi:uncharacterized membrane protein YdbT with pleckstrin-like domain